MSVAYLATVVLAGFAVALWVGPSPRRMLAQRDIGRPASVAPGDVLGGEQAAGLAGSRAAGARIHGHAGTPGRPTRRLTDAAATWVRARSWVTATWRARDQAAKRRALTVELCTAVGAELRSGAMPSQAVARAVDSVPGLCDEVGRVAALGGDVVRALHVAAGRAGAAGLGHLSVAWSVTELTGSGLAPACDRVGSMLRDEQALRREVSAQLAGARATARLLGVLPLFGLVLGAGIGGRPWEFLLGTPYGLGCLLSGLVLVALGLWWTERLVRSVEDQI